jgi:hypothetical protein
MGLQANQSNERHTRELIGDPACFDPPRYSCKCEYLLHTDPRTATALNLVLDHAFSTPRQRSVRKHPVSKSPNFPSWNRPLYTPTLQVRGEFRTGCHWRHLGRVRHGRKPSWVLAPQTPYHQINLISVHLIAHKGPGQRRGATCFALPHR